MRFWSKAKREKKNVQNYLMKVITLKKKKTTKKKHPKSYCFLEGLAERDRWPS